jgi:uncharacterized damage-inducible protein DinB
METYFQTIYDYFIRLHEDARQVVRDVPQEKLDWSPGEGVNSMAVLVVHMVAAERFWIGDVALGEPSNRDRASEFEVSGLPLEDLLARLERSERYLGEALARLTLEDLNVVQISPRNGKEVTVGYCLAHALAHTALHVGHLQLMAAEAAVAEDGSSRGGS